MSQTRKILLYIVLLLLTIAYSWLIDLGIRAFCLVVSLQPDAALPLPTLWLSMRQLPWQLLASISLLVNLFWALRSEKKNTDGRGHLYAAVLHASWLLLCLMAHVLGMLLPFVSRSYVIR